MKTLVSIITISLNNELGLERTLKSIKGKKDDCTELVLVDGGSCDGSADVISKYKGTISKCISEADKGIYDAMNKGISLSSGEWVVFINSGDELLCDIAEIRSELKGDFKFIYGLTVVRDSNMELFTWGRKLKSAIDTIVDPPFFHQSVFYNKKYISSYPLEYSLIADRVMTYKLVERSKEDTWKFVNKKFASFYDGGISTQSGGMVIEEERRFLTNNGLLTASLKRKLFKKSLVFIIKSIIHRTPLYTFSRKLWWRMKLSNK